MSSAATNGEQPYIVEHDPRWTAVDAFQFSHLFPLTRPHHDAITHAFTNSMAQGLENISVAPSKGKFLSIQCQIIGAKHVLEIGTLGAYSTISMASASPDTKVVTVEIDPAIAEIARENIRCAKMEDRIELIVGAPLDILPLLAQDVAAGRRPPFDFSFIDVDKANALNYFNWAVKMTRKRGVVYVDNMVKKGLLADAELAERDENVRGIREAVEGVEACVLQTVGEKNHDGFLMAVVK